MRHRSCCSKPELFTAATMNLPPHAHHDGARPASGKRFHVYLRFGTFAPLAAGAFFLNLF